MKIKLEDKFTLFWFNPGGWECKYHENYGWHFPGRMPNKTLARKYLAGLRKLLKLCQDLSLFSRVGPSYLQSHDHTTPPFVWERFDDVRLYLGQEDVIRLASKDARITFDYNGGFTAEVA